ncbi:hypothetical protein Q8F55_004996 [Vanrija albida]|uniref:DNA replication factor Cdt1 C-terminal domain-containing protein n=1 Tax=Vanrija albida TaxID=181172 RepID=A0ABR3Q0D6_9TREE
MSHELAPLFPSATHPALPVAADILSTLRHLTAPGKGNDLRPEERTALVGVAALLGCERVQSHDLLETAVQRASSVSPARFKSALATSRRLLATADAQSPSRRRPATQSAPAPSAAPALSPFATPKKRFKYASGVDVSALVSPHAPATGSPLRACATPSRLAAAENDADTTPSKRAGGGETTPSKRARGDDDEVELETTPTKRTSARRRADDDVAAFFALRPGAGSSPDNGKAAAAAPPDASLDFLRRLPSPAPLPRPRAKRPRRDWRYAEGVWGLDAARAAALVSELAAGVRDGDADADPEPRGTTVPALILATWP